MIRLVYERGDFGAGATELVSDGALLVRLLAAVQRPLPAAHADLLQPPAALGADRDRRRQPRDHRGRRVRPLRAVRRRRDRRRDRDRDRGERRRAGRGPAPARSAGSSSGGSPGRRRGSLLASAALAGGQLRRLGRCSTTRSGAGLGGPDRLARDRARRRRRRLRGRDHAAADPRGGADLGAAAAWRWRRRGRARGRRRARRGPARARTRSSRKTSGCEEDDGEPLEDEPLDEEPFDETGEHPVDGPATVLVIESGDRAGEEFADRARRGRRSAALPTPTSSSTT